MKKNNAVMSNCYDCKDTVQGKKKEIPKVIDEYKH